MDRWATACAKNTPDADLGGIPLLAVAGPGDEVINIVINETCVAAQCAAG